MKERPIIFSAPMVRAILEGRKTQTRRIVKPQLIAWLHDKRGWELSRTEQHAAVFADTFAKHYSQHGKAGDRLWVREAFSYYEHPELYDCIRYKADGHCQKPDFGKMTEEECGRFEMNCDGCGCADHRWRSPIHMPRWASRITLEITNIRVERLQDISEADAQAEGVTESIVLPGDRGSFVASFGYLWESIYGAGSWNANPWVWVIEFERVKGGDA